MTVKGHSLPIHSARVPINVRYASDSDQIADEAVCRLSANSGRTAQASRPSFFSSHMSLGCKLVCPALGKRLVGADSYFYWGTERAASR